MEADADRHRGQGEQRRGRVIADIADVRGAACGNPGSGWAVTSGRTGGEVVVVQGIQRLTDGMTVTPS